MSLAKKMLKNVKGGVITTLDKSEFGVIPYYVPSPTTLINLAVSSQVDGGIASSKLTMFSGITSSGKTRIAQMAMLEFLNTYKDGAVLYIDAEYALERSSVESSIVEEYVRENKLKLQDLENISETEDDKLQKKIADAQAKILSAKDKLEKDGFDTSRIIHMPLARVIDEDKNLSVTYNFIQLTKDLDKDDKLFILIDSLSALQGLDDIEKSDSGKITRSMNHGIVEKKRFLNRVLETAGLKRIPVVVINQVTTNLGFGASHVAKGGSLLYIPSQSLIFTSKASLKGIDGVHEVGMDDKKDVVGSIIRSSTDKGRLAREKIAIRFAQHDTYGFLKYFDLEPYALSGGYITAGKDGRSTVYRITSLGEDSPIMKKKSMYLPEYYPFWEKLFEVTDFADYLESFFKYGSNKHIPAILEEVTKSDNSDSIDISDSEIKN